MYLSSLKISPNTDIQLHWYTISTTKNSERPPQTCFVILPISANATPCCFCTGQKAWSHPSLSLLLTATSNPSRNSSICTSRYFQNPDASYHIYHNHPGPMTEQRYPPPCSCPCPQALFSAGFCQSDSAKQVESCHLYAQNNPDFYVT